MDLTWTGNQFLSDGHNRFTLGASANADLTRKDEDPWAADVAAALARHYTLPPGCFRVASGATQMIESLLRSFPGAEIVDITPNFHLAHTLARQEDWPYVSLPIRAPSELKTALAPHLVRPNAIIVLSSPRNPLGYQFPVRELGDLIASATATFIVDEVYADFATDSLMAVAARLPNLFVVRTLSKAWGLADLRIGYAVSAAFDRGFKLRLIPNAVSGVAQRAAMALLAEPDAVRESVEATIAARSAMILRLGQCPDLSVWPSDANYVCVETPRAANLAECLSSAGYLVRLLHDLKGYPADWPHGIRIAVPATAHCERVCEIMLDALRTPEDA